MGSHGHASQAGTRLTDTSKNIDRKTNIKGIDGLGTDGISQINLGSVARGHATQEGMGKMHGTREIVHQAVGGAAARREGRRAVERGCRSVVDRYCGTTCGRPVEF